MFLHHLAINLYLFYIVWSQSGYHSSNKSYFSLIAQSYALGFYQIRVMTMLKKNKSQMAYAVIIALISFVVFIPSPKPTFSETAEFVPAEFTDAERNWIEAHPVIYTAHDPVFAPYEYWDDTSYQGLAMDYLDWIEANYPLKFQSKQYETWSDALDALKTGAVNLLPAITETPQRKEFASFTQAYIIVHNVVLIRREFDDSFTEEDLVNMRTAVIKDYYAQDLMENKYPGIDLYKMIDIEEALRALSFGKIDALILDTGQAAYYISESGIGNLQMNDNIRLGFQLELAMATSLDSPELISILNKILCSMPDATRESLKSKWIKIEFDPGISENLFYLVLAVLIGILLIAIGIFLWNQTLNKLVREKTTALEDELEIRNKLEQQLNNIINAIPYPIYAKDRQHHFIYVNEAYSNAFGMSRRDMVGMLDSDAYKILSRVDPDVFEECDCKVYEEGIPCQIYGQKITHVNVEERIYDTRKVPFPLIDEASTGLLGITVDITQRLLAEQALEKINAKLEAKVERRTHLLNETNKELEKSMYKLQLSEQSLMKANDELTASIDALKTTQAQLLESEKLAALGRIVVGVAHEINTPLGNGITASSYLALKNTALKETSENGALSKKHLAEFIDTVESTTTILMRSLTKASDIVNAFKLLAPKDRDLQQIPVPLKLLIMKPMKRIIADSPCKVRIQCEDKLVVHSDPEALAIVFSHFFSNTILHGFGGAPTEDCHIDIACRVEENTLFITFSDNGKGVEADILNLITEPLYTTNRGGGNVGLGLTIVHSIITHGMNGEIHFVRKQPHGLCIEIKIPVAPG